MNIKNILTVNRILLGLLMLVAGLMKLFVFTPSGVAENTIMKIALFSWAPIFWAWVLILSEIVFGIAILASWRLKYTVWPPIIIMLVAAFTVYWGNWSSFIMHLVVASNYLMLSYKSR
ncbi:DoxX family protein [Candidatus Pacearchaeota archaeon]|nr:DoxX family protein [Candidatus Pacearchaeota archaeon]